MTAPLRHDMDREAFFRWLDQQTDGRWELVGGEPMMMVGATRAHGLLVGAIARLLHSRFAARGLEVQTSDFGVITSSGVRYPDVVLYDPAGLAREARATEHPLLLVEVLSASTRALDLGQKRAEYCAIPTVAAYLAVDPETGACRARVRGSAGFEAQDVSAARSISVPLLQAEVDVPPPPGLEVGGAPK